MNGVFDPVLCEECGSDLGDVPFHADGCSHNGRIKLWPLKAIRAARQQNVDALVWSALLNRFIKPR